MDMNPGRVVKANKQAQEKHQLLSPSSSLTKSPEFEFWMVRNPSFPQPNLLSADELFSDGVLLPLHLLQPNNHHHHHSDPRSSLPDPASPASSSSSVAAAAEPITSLTSSKRWTDIFKKKSEKKAAAAAAAAAAASNKNQEEDRDREKGTKEKDEKTREKKKATHSRGSSSAELNIINIWPFSRSRSAGNNTGSRPRMLFPGARKASSAPCSRSNSSGESNSRKWPSSPGRPGLHLGRSSPVWQVRRSSSGTSGVSGSGSGCNAKKSNNFYHDPLLLVDQSGEKGAGKKEVTAPPRRSKTSSGNGSGSNNNGDNNDESGGSANSKAKVLNLKVPPMCVGYRNHLSCRSDENGGIIGTAAAGGSKSTGGVKNGKGSNRNIYNLGSNGGNGNVFNFFTKKVY